MIARYQSIHRRSSPVRCRDSHSDLPGTSSSFLHGQSLIGALCSVSIATLSVDIKLLYIYIHIHMHLLPSWPSFFARGTTALWRVCTTAC